MPSPLDFFQAGQAGGNASSFPGLQASNYLMDMFNKQMQMRMQMNMLLGNEYAKQSIMNQIDPVRQKAAKELQAETGDQSGGDQTTGPTPNGAGGASVPGSIAGGTASGSPSQPSPNMLVEKDRKMLNKTYGNPSFGAQEEQFKRSMQSNENFNKAMNVVRVALPTMKGAFAQQGGQSGLIPGMVGGLAAKAGIGNTYNIAALPQAYNDITANVAQQYSGNQGISKLFSAFAGGVPSPTDSEQNALAKVIMAAKTSYGINKAISKSGIDPTQLGSIDPGKIQQLIGDPHAQYSPEEGKYIEDAIMNEYRNTPATTLPNPKTGATEPIAPNAFNGLLSSFTNQQPVQSQGESEGPTTKVSSKGFKYTVHKGA